MSMYDYYCKNPGCEMFLCSKPFEKIVQGFASPDPPCPACGRPSERAQVSGRPATFRWGKGGGWN